MPPRDPMHPTFAAAATFIVTLVAGMLYARPYLKELNQLRSDNYLQATRLKKMELASSTMHKRMAMLSSHGSACVRGRDADRRARMAPAALFSQLTNNTVPVKQKRLSPARLKLLQEKRRKRLAARKKEKLLRAGGGGSGAAAAPKAVGNKQTTARPSAVGGSSRRLSTRTALAAAGGASRLANKEQR